jgi:hypothetical protein
MKLEEMADVLDGLATAMEKCLGKTAISDFHAYQSPTALQEYGRGAGPENAP